MLDAVDGAEQHGIEDADDDEVPLGIEGKLVEDALLGGKKAGRFKAVGGVRGAPECRPKYSGDLSVVPNGCSIVCACWLGKGVKGIELKAWILDGGGRELNGEEILPTGGRLVPVGGGGKLEARVGGTVGVMKDDTGGGLEDSDRADEEPKAAEGTSFGGELEVDDLVNVWERLVNAVVTPGKQEASLEEQD